MAKESEVNNKKAILLAYDCFDLQHPNNENKISESELTALLANYLNHLIDTNINSVMTILYRIDVDEQKVNAILFSDQNDKTIGESLAYLIIERQKLKLYYRQKFN